MSDWTAEGGPPVGSSAGDVGDAAAVPESLPAAVDADETDALPDVERESVAAEEAFGALGNEVRTAVLETLADADGRLGFSELFEATTCEKTAGFAYHLRQLTGHFVRKVDDAYELTAAGRRAARDLRAGAYTDRVSFAPVAVGDPCPFCDGDLVAAAAEGDVAVACRDCGQPVLQLPLPPGGVEGRNPAEAVAALDSHHRRRLAAMADGVCPECGGSVEGALVKGGGGLGGHEEAVRATMRCVGCGSSLASPVTLTVLDHPAVVALYHRHGEDLGERSIWNVGAEWRETVVSTEPWLVKVETTVGGEWLAVYVDGGLDVVGTDQSAS